MTKTRNYRNQVLRGLLLVLVAALGLPCAACDDAASPARHLAVVTAHAPTSDHPDSCQCVSCKPKVHVRKAVWSLSIPAVILPAPVLFVDEPDSVSLIFPAEAKAWSLPPLISYHSDRAPPCL
jgi:hypothetical protein